MRVLPHTDLYQLGDFLWKIVSYEPFPDRRHYPYCKTVGCASEVGAVCSEPYAHSIPLPLLQLDAIGSTIPEYMRAIISSCRKILPKDRSTAWELLDMFPAPTDSENGRQSPSTYVTRPEDYWRQFSNRLCCDRCGRLSAKHYYHCFVCNMDDFDLCLLCFEEGEHCPEPQHYLAEFVSRTNTGKRRYFSSVRESGHRDILML
ncbi:hypothetical protein GQ53DRAFT_134109 [Thozetella sp. PMI_491]|nr:hypothetical protein GQ53DRAFT_134109 [Thozetella sp. PMI_491]